MQQRFDVLGVPVIDSRELFAYLPRPDRHRQKPQRWIIETVIAFVSFTFYAIVQYEIASEECEPGIGRIGR